MEKKWMLRIVLIVAISLTRNLTSGSRNESIEVGNTENLLCTNTSIQWNKRIFVIWKIISQTKNCSIGLSVNDPDYDTCEDGKKININEDGIYSLIIPNFSIEDEGKYICDVSYHAGGYVETIHVSAWARPNVSGWLEEKSGYTFAVCEVQSKPAASIQWITPWDSSSHETHLPQEINGVFTVTSKLQLPHSTSYKNFTCVATISNPKWTETRLFTFNFHAIDTPKWPFILLGVCATCTIVSLLTGLYIMRKKLKELSVFRKICCTPQTPAPKEEKAPQPCDPEEVEPYASYVQRVNSIYNSSAELFNA